MKNADMPTHPQSGAVGPSGDTFSSEYFGGCGLTKREEFAGRALQGLVSDDGMTMAGAAKLAVEAADALLTELEKVDETTKR